MKKLEDLKKNYQKICQKLRKIGQKLVYRTL